MNHSFADLHIHSVYSDGTFDPERIVAEALQRGVGCIAVCDHNVVGGMQAAAPLAKAAGLGFVPGVEIDSIMMGVDAHILCYGADFSDAPLLAQIRHARARLDFMSDELLRRMLPDFPTLSCDEYLALPHDSAQGGWKLLQYLKAKGVTRRLNEAIPFYDQYGVTYAAAGFASAEEIISAIHAAGGCAVLAHPGVTFGEAVSEGVRAALALGIDGIECHYPRHDAALTEFLLDFCRAHDLDVTAGSDCHGAYGRADIGETRTPFENLRLNHPAFRKALY